MVGLGTLILAYTRLRCVCLNAVAFFLVFDIYHYFLTVYLGPDGWRYGCMYVLKWLSYIYISISHIPFCFLILIVNLVRFHTTYLLFLSSLVSLVCLSVVRYTEYTGTYFYLAG
jgi:hypothetical protein